MVAGRPAAGVRAGLAGLALFDLRQLKLENRRAPKAYFRGLNFLLNEQQDQAIDAFIEAVQNDPDTQELHFALGNLFRRPAAAKVPARRARARASCSAAADLEPR